MAGKSVQLSVEKRNAGNAVFQKKKDGEALTLYTEAVFSGKIFLLCILNKCKLKLAEL